MSTSAKRLSLQALLTAMALLFIGLNLSTFIRVGAKSPRQIYSGQAKVQETPVEQSSLNITTHLLGAGYTAKGHTRFLAGCRHSCVEQDQSQQTSAFCEMYCNCTYVGLRNNIPLKDLQTLSEGNHPPSIQAIETIQKQCLQAAASLQAQRQSVGISIKVALLPAGHPG